MSDLKTIKKSIYFKNLIEQDFNALIRCVKARVKIYKENEIIVHPGDSSSYIYVIITGYAREIKDEIDGNYVLGLDYEKNDIYGLEYINQKDKTYKDTLISLSECCVLICDRFRFLNPCDNYCKRHIDLNLHTMNEFAKLSKGYKDRIVVISKGSTKEKVLDFLKNIAKEKKSNEFYIPYTREELACLLAVERTALSATLSLMKKEGLIDFKRNYFKIN